VDFIDFFRVCCAALQLVLLALLLFVVIPHGTMVLHGESAAVAQPFDLMLPNSASGAELRTDQRAQEALLAAAFKKDKKDKPSGDGGDGGDQAKKEL
jgi:hypothetical protein